MYIRHHVFSKQNKNNFYLDVIVICLRRCLLHVLNTFQLYDIYMKIMLFCISRWDAYCSCTFLYQPQHWQGRQLKNIYKKELSFSKDIIKINISAASSSLYKICKCFRKVIQKEIFIQHKKSGTGYTVFAYRYGIKAGSYWPLRWISSAKNTVSRMKIRTNYPRPCAR
jgi:hypothetical protein